MSYLLDKKSRQKKIVYAAAVAVLAILLIFFRASVYQGLSRAASAIFRPVMVLSRHAGAKIKNISPFFVSKEILYKENQNLSAELAQKNALLSNYASVVDENERLKTILGRKSSSANMIVASILAKPNISAYDTLVIDAGSDAGVSTGDRVFALGNVPIGYIAQVSASSAKVLLFSNPGEKTEAVITGQDAFMQAVGRGGGNFEITLPHDFSISPGTEVRLPGIENYVLGTVAGIISDPRDAFTKALLVSPVNVEDLAFVEVEK